MSSIGQRQDRDVGQGVNLDEKCTICMFLIRPNDTIGLELPCSDMKKVIFYVFRFTMKRDIEA